MMEVPLTTAFSHPNDTPSCHVPQYEVAEAPLGCASPENDPPPPLGPVNEPDALDAEVVPVNAYPPPFSVKELLAAE